MGDKNPKKAKKPKKDIKHVSAAEQVILPESDGSKKPKKVK